MSEKELLYIDDILSNITNINDFLNENIEEIEDEDFKKELEGLSKVNKEFYKKFYKLIEE